MGHHYYSRYCILDTAWDTNNYSLFGDAFCGLGLGGQLYLQLNVHVIRHIIKTFFGTVFVHLMMVIAIASRLVHEGLQQECADYNSKLTLEHGVSDRPSKFHNNLVTIMY